MSLASFRGNIRISHFMPALESLGFLCSQLSSCGLRLDLHTGLSPGRGFCRIHWISSALSSVTQCGGHSSTWLTARGDQASELFTARLFALAVRYIDGDARLWGKVNGELHGAFVTHNKLLQRHNHWSMSSPESSSACPECILFAALDTRTWARAKPRVLVSSSPVLWSATSSCEKDARVDEDAVRHNIHVAISVIPSSICRVKRSVFFPFHTAVCVERCFNTSYSHNLKRNIVVEVNSCLFSSLTPVALWKLCAV